MYSLPTTGLAGKTTEKGAFVVLFTPMYKSVARALNGLIDVITTGIMNDPLLLISMTVFDTQRSSSPSIGVAIGPNDCLCCIGKIGNVGNGMMGNKGLIDCI